jgi:hypothetical protein
MEPPTSISHAKMAGLNPILEELRGLIRATHLFAQNYRTTAPSNRVTECAFLRLEEALLGAMRKGVRDLHHGPPYQQEKFIHLEIERLIRPNDTRRALEKRLEDAGL